MLTHDLKPSKQRILTAHDTAGRLQSILDFVAVGAKSVPDKWAFTKSKLLAAAALRRYRRQTVRGLVRALATNFGALAHIRFHTVRRGAT